MLPRRLLMLAAILVMVASGGALAVTVLPLPVEAKFEARFVPTALSKTEQTPLAMRLGIGFRPTESAPLPALEVFELEEDRHVRLNLDGVPVCSPGASLDEEAFQVRCSRALVARGRMKLNVHFPESVPIPIDVPLRAYNGPAVGGAGTLLFVFESPVPRPTLYVSKVSVETAANRPYGPKLVWALPGIAGGHGSVTRFGLRFRKGIFSAVCRNLHLTTGFEARFSDGTKLSGGALRFCARAPANG